MVGVGHGQGEIQVLPQPKRRLAHQVGARDGDIPSHPRAPIGLRRQSNEESLPERRRTGGCV